LALTQKLETNELTCHSGKMSESKAGKDQNNNNNNTIAQNDTIKKRVLG
jgi:hypothetical protein